MDRILRILSFCVLTSITTFGQNMMIKPYSCEWIAAKAATEKLTPSPTRYNHCSAIEVRAIQMSRSYQVDILCTQKAKYRATVYVRANAAGCYLENLYGNPFIKPLN